MDPFEKVVAFALAMIGLSCFAVTLAVIGSIAAKANGCAW